MKYRVTAFGVLFAIGCSLVTLRAEQPEAAADPAAKRVAVASSLVEARSRATLLHETIHGTLQVVHRDLFDEDDAHTIPSASLEDVFHAMADSFQVEMKWLVVNTDVVNVDHRPEDEFEHAAVKALAAGKPYFDRVQEDRYRFAGSIRLASQCLKCHVKHRTSTHDRTAGLLISMPLNLDAAATKE
ncbi:c-type heme family protein [Rosistilla oblonga]|uniref:c-type heme family protein n=1 Tax=Rosistilla oblonga TaxID=2527990 RepID=UPI003A97841F